jgi:phosphoribosylpyrophosphate synthetase
MLIFALNATREFGAAVAGALGVELAPHDEREFEGEHKARPLISVTGHDAYVVQLLHGGQALPSAVLRRRAAGRRRAARDRDHQSPTPAISRGTFGPSAANDVIKSAGI